MPKFNFPKNEEWNSCEHDGRYDPQTAWNPRDDGHLRINMIKNRVRDRTLDAMRPKFIVNDRLKEIVQFEDREYAERLSERYELFMPCKGVDRNGMISS